MERLVLGPGRFFAIKKVPEPSLYDWDEGTPRCHPNCRQFADHFIGAIKGTNLRLSPAAPKVDTLCFLTARTNRDLSEKKGTMIAFLIAEVGIIPCLFCDFKRIF